ncbi:MAG: peptidase dimerization domain-containing protein [Vicinamibacterales bacterium]
MHPFVRHNRSFVALVALLAAGLLATLTARAQAPARVIPADTAETAALRQALDREIDALAPRMLEMSDWMYSNPEPGFLEFKASAMLADELRKHGFIVEMGVPGLPENFDRLKVVGGVPADQVGPSGMPTAFKAKYKGRSEAPVIGIAVEYDALRGNPPFHGCQHNMQGPTGLAAAIALARVMEKNKVPGSVWVIGTPAEEVGPPAKAAQAKAGYYDGIDFMLRSHGTTDETIRYPGGFSARHIRQMKYTFYGKSAHAQGAWEGRSALDAVLLLFHAMDMLREHSQPQFRFHGVIPDGGVAPNIVPETASAVMWIRHIIDETPVGAVSPKTAGELIEAKVQQLDEAARGAAMATGTKVDVDHYGEYIPGIGVGVLEDIMFQYAVDYGGTKVGKRNVPNQWEETGFGTMKVPGVQVHIGTAETPEVAGHSKENAELGVSAGGRKSLILTSKVMAATALRLLRDQPLREKAKAEHASWVEKYNQ